MLTDAQKLDILNNLITDLESRLYIQELNDKYAGVDPKSLADSLNAEKSSVVQAIKLSSSTVTSG